MNRPEILLKGALSLGTALLGIGGGVAMCRDSAPEAPGVVLKTADDLMGRSLRECDLHLKTPLNAHSVTSELDSLSARVEMVMDANTPDQTACLDKVVAEMAKERTSSCDVTLGTGSWIGAEGGVQLSVTADCLPAYLDEDQE